MSTELLVALVGIGSTALGATIALVGSIIRDRAAAKRAEVQRKEDRSQELWQLSLPAAQRAQELMAEVVAMSEPNVFKPDMGGVLRLQDHFDEWWEDKRHAFDIDVSLIPDEQVRAKLALVALGIDRSYGIAMQTDYAPNFYLTLGRVAKLGFDQLGAWRRGEQNLTRLDGEFTALLAAQQAFDRWWAFEHGDETEPEDAP